MTTLGSAILSIVDFISYPTWHLVVLYTILLIIVAYATVKSWGP